MIFSFKVYIMSAYIRFILNHPRSVIGALLIVTVILGAGIPNLKFDNSIDVMMPQKDKEYLYYEKVKEVYGNIGKFIIISVTSDNIWTRDFFQEIGKFIDDLEEYKEYAPDREDQRISKLTEVLQKASTPAELLQSFGNDPAFCRTLQRCFTKLTIDKKQLSFIDKKDIKKAIQSSINLKKGQLIDHIISPVTAKDISGENDALESLDIIDRDEEGKRILPRSEQDMAVLQKRLKKNPAFNRALYSADPKTGNITDFCVLVNLKSKKEDVISNEIINICDSYTSIELTVHGYPVVYKVMNDYMQKDLKTFLPLVTLIVSIVFFLNFKSFRGVLLPFLTLILTDIWTLGLMGHLGKKISVVEVSLPTLLVAVGSSYSIHIINQYYNDFSTISKVGIKRGLSLSMSHISVTVLLAGITTFLGFISLTTNQVTGIREWGLFSAIGVFFAVIIATSLIPAVMVIMPHKRLELGGLAQRSQKESFIDKIIERFTMISTSHYRAVIITIVIIVIISLAGLARLKVETAFMAFFKKDDPIRINSLIIGKKYGGSAGISILIDSGEADGIYNPEFLKTIDSIREWLVLKENKDLYIGRTDAFTDVIKSMHMAVNNDNPKFYRIPDSRMEIMDYMEIYSGRDDDSDGRFDDFESYYDQNLQTAMIFAKIWEGDQPYHSTSYLKYIHDKIDQHLTKILHGKYKHKLTGEPAIIIQLSDYVTSGQLMSLFSCFMAVIIMVILLFKNWKAGIVSMVPMSFAVLINFGIMGWFNIRLDTATAIIASITIGIGVDDTIHFLNTYRHFRKQGHSVDKTISATLALSGRAITYTSLALIFGFSILVVSNFYPIILFGILSSITMIVTTLGALIVLPSVIKASGINLDESSSNSLFWRIFYIGRFFNIEGHNDDN